MRGYPGIVTPLAYVTMGRGFSDAFKGSNTGRDHLAEAGVLTGLVTGSNRSMSDLGASAAAFG